MFDLNAGASITFLAEGQLKIVTADWPGAHSRASWGVTGWSGAGRSVASSAVLCLVLGSCLTALWVQVLPVCDLALGVSMSPDVGTTSSQWWWSTGPSIRCETLSCPHPSGARPSPALSCPHALLPSPGLTLQLLSLVRGQVQQDILAATCSSDPRSPPTLYQLEASVTKPLGYNMQIS